MIETKKGQCTMPVVKQRYYKNCMCCGKFVKKEQWVKIEGCDGYKKGECGALCYECIGNIEHTSRD